MRCRLALNIALVATIVSLQACNVHNKLGAATPDRAIERYLLALETKDESLMARLVPPNYTATKEIAAKIDRLGGHKLQERRVTYTKTKPTLWSAKIDGVYVDRHGIRKKFEDTISTIYQGTESWKLYRGRWYLLLGKDNGTQI